MRTRGETPSRGCVFYTLTAPVPTGAPGNRLRACDLLQYDAVLRYSRVHISATVNRLEVEFNAAPQNRQAAPANVEHREANSRSADGGIIGRGLFEVGLCFRAVWKIADL